MKTDQRARTPGGWILLLVFTLAALLFTHPLVFSWGDAVTDPVDPLLNTWILGWTHHALLTQPLELLDANIFYPYEQTLLYSETLLLPALLLLPVSTATGDPILAHNLLVLWGLASTGGSGYLLGRWLFRSRWAGLALGVVLAFNSYTLTNLAQVQLVQFTWLPLALLYVAKLLRRPRTRFALLFALFLAAQFYTVIYYGLFGFLLAGLTGATGWLLTSFPSARARWRALGLLAGGAAVAVLACLPLALPYANLSRARGFVRTVGDAWPFSASLEMWLTSPAHNLVYGGWLGNELPTVGFYPVDALFPGVLLIVLAIGGLLLWIGRPDGEWTRGERLAAARYPLALLLGIGLFFLLSLGPHPQVASLQPNFDQILPYAWVHRWVPGFQALRAPNRFAILVFLGLGIAAAHLLARLRWRGVQALLVILLLMENVTTIPASTLYRPTLETDRRAAHAWLATEDETVFLELPVASPGLGSPPETWLASQLASVMHWHPTPAGYSGFWPPRHDDLLLFLAQFPADNVVRLLQALGVRRVLLDVAQLPPEQRQRIQEFIAETQWPVHEWGGVWGMEVPPSAEPVTAPRRQIHVPSTARAEGTLTLSLLLSAERPTPVLPDSPLGRLRGEWFQGEEMVLAAEVNAQPPFAVDPLAVVPVPLPVPVETGAYVLRLRDPRTEELLAETSVTVVDDVAPPEVTILPVIPDSAEVICVDARPTLRLHLRTVGWYDDPFTLSARLLDVQGNELARNAADVEFPAHRPRTNLLTTHAYDLPLPDHPPAEVDAVVVTAYRWQQEAERTVPRWFARPDGTVADSLRLPLPSSRTGC